MTKEDRERLGRKLRAMRAERGLDQIDVAEDPKAGISVGTLQAIEGAWYEVRDTNIEKYARFFGTTVKRLLAADEPRAVTPSDPLLKDLHEEHLEIARAYMRARKRVRMCVELLLSPHPAEETLTTLLLKLEKLPPERLAQIEALVSAPADPRVELLIDRLRQRFAADPGFITLMEQSLSHTAAPDHVVKKRSTTPTRRA